MLIAQEKQDTLASVLMFVGALNWLFVAYKLSSLSTSPIPDLFATLAKSPITKYTPKEAAKYATLKQTQMLVYVVVGVAALSQSKKTYTEFKTILPMQKK